MLSALYNTAENELMLSQTIRSMWTFNDGGLGEGCSRTQQLPTSKSQNFLNMEDSVSERDCAGRKPETLSLVPSFASSVEQSVRKVRIIARGSNDHAAKEHLSAAAGAAQSSRVLHPQP